MFKLCVFVALIAYGSAGLISLDEGYGVGSYGGYGGIALAPKVAVAVKAGATSYQNSNLLSLNPTAVVTKAVAAPVITKVAAPIAYAAPVAKIAYAAPIAAPAVSVVGLGHYGLGDLGYGYGKY